MSKAEQIYGFANWRWDKHALSPGGLIENLLAQRAGGICIVDSTIREVTAQFAELCKRAGLDVILAFGMNARKPDTNLLGRAMAISSKLAIGNTRLGEWVGRGGAAREYLNLADKFGYEWVCPVTHKAILKDMRDGGALRARLGDTMCMCFCGHILGGYIFADSQIPSQSCTTLAGRNLYEEFGLTAQSLTDYLNPMNVLSGAGSQGGLNGGSRLYAALLGFKGLVIGMPFDLTDSLNVDVYDEPESYPPRCGDFSEGYRG